jgi:hypothetical protein
MDTVYLQDSMDSTDETWTRPEQLKIFLQRFDQWNTNATYSVAVFCGFRQIESFREAMMEVLDKVERRFWFKESASYHLPTADGVVSQVETLLLGFKYPSVPSDWQRQYSQDDPQQRSNVLSFKEVKQTLAYKGEVSKI